MAIEIVDAVRKAELDAIQKEKDAKIKSDGILLKAHNDAKDMIDSIQNESIEISNQNIERAQDQVKGAIHAAIQEAESEILQLKLIVSQKEQAVIDLIISEITN